MRFFLLLFSLSYSFLVSPPSQAQHATSGESQPWRVSVRVVDADNGRSVPDLKFFRIKRQDLPFDFESDLYHHLKEALVAAEVFQCDQEGHCQIDSVDHDSLLVVWTEDRFGFMAAAAKDQQHWIKTQRYRLAQVEVVGQEGQAIPDLRVSVLDYWNPNSFFDLAPGWAGETDAHGQVSLFVVSADSFVPDGRLYALAAAAFAEPPMAKLKADAKGQLHGRLVLPPHGRMQITVKAVAGQTLPEASLRVTAFRKLPEPAVEDQRLMKHQVVLPIGAARPRVTMLAGLDEEFQLQLAAVHLQESLSWRTKGPNAVGKTKKVRVSLPAASGRFLIRGRLLDPEGEAFVDTEFQFLATNNERVVDQSLEQTAWTDAKGGFELPIDVIRAESTTPLSLFIRLNHLRDEHNSRFVALKIDSAIALELDDIIMPVEAIAAAGRVVDDLGRPLEGVWLRPEAHSWDDASAQRRGSIGSASRSDKFGRFEFRSNDAKNDFKFWVAKRGFEDQLVHVNLGQRDLEICMTRHAKVQGRLQDSNGESGKLAGLRATLSSFTELYMAQVEVDENGAFSALVSPGQHQLKLIIQGLAKNEFLDLGEVNFVPGETHDLGVLTLPGRLCRLELVSQPSMAPVEGSYRMRILAPDSVQPLEEQEGYSSKGVILFTVDSLPVDVELWPHQLFLAPQCFRVDSSLTQVQLVAGANRPIRLRLDGVHSLPERSMLRLDVWRLGANETDAKLVGTFEVSAKFPRQYLWAPKGNQYRVRTSLIMNDETLIPLPTSLGAETANFTVAGGEGTQVEIIKLDRDIVLQALKIPAER